MLHSTPYQKPVVTQSTPGLPTFTPKMGLLHEVKDALRQYGRSIDTPAPASQPKIAARGPLSTNVSLLSIRGRQPLQGILKNRPSLDSLAAGIDLPPIPNKVRKAASKEVRAAQKSNDGRSQVLAHPLTHPAAMGQIATPVRALETVSEDGLLTRGQLSPASVPHPIGQESQQPERISASAVSALGLPIELSFEHEPTQLEEMEMVMTQLDKASTHLYLAESTHQPSRPHSFHGQVSAPRLLFDRSARPSQQGPKCSTATTATIDSLGEASAMDSPSPAMAWGARRGSLLRTGQDSTKATQKLDRAQDRESLSKAVVERSSVYGQTNVSRLPPHAKRTSRVGLKPLILPQRLSDHIPQDSHTPQEVLDVQEHKETVAPSDCATGGKLGPAESPDKRILQVKCQNTPRARKQVTCDKPLLGKATSVAPQEFDVDDTPRAKRIGLAQVRVGDQIPRSTTRTEVRRYKSSRSTGPPKLLLRL